MKEIIDKMDFIKIKNVCSATEKKKTDWKKYFQKTYKDLLSKVYKELLNLNNKKQPN